MPTATPLTALLFSSLVLATALIVITAFHRAGVSRGTVALLVLAYLALPGGLAAAGKLDRYDPLPAPALLLLLGLSLLTILVIFTPTGRRLALAFSIGAVITLQGFRILVELLLHRLYAEAAIPVQMTYSGRNFDIVSGLTGLLLGLWLLRGRSAPRAVLWAWNGLGLALLANIVIVAVLSTPVPFRGFTEGPPNLVPSTFPYVWLPSFLVQVALGSHLLIFRMLRPPRTDTVLDPAGAHS